MMNSTSRASHMAATDVLAFSPASRQPGYDAGEGQRIRGFKPVGAGLPRLHGLKVPLIDMRLRVDDTAVPTPAIVIARVDGRLMAILVDDVADMLPAGGPNATATDPDCIVGVTEPGQHSMVLLSVEKLSPPTPLA